jgi:ketosteroid isomerase-like protein
MASVDRSDVERWLQGYLRAWKSDDPKEIAALFTEDAIYSPYPWPREDRYWRGRDLIVSKWIGHGDSKIGWRFEHEIVAVEADTAVVAGWTEYDRGEGLAPWEEAYANIWIVRLADDGRCREFVEYWVERPRQPSST